MKHEKKDRMSMEDIFALQRQANGFMAVWDAAAKGENAENIDRIYIKGAEFRAFHEELMAKDAAYKENFEKYQELTKDETFKKLDKAVNDVSKMHDITSLFNMLGKVARHYPTFRKATKHQQKAVNIFAENYELKR